jgi:hypothetical protein
MVVPRKPGNPVSFLVLRRDIEVAFRQNAYNIATSHT